MTCSQMKQTRKKRHDLLTIPRNLQNSSTIQEYKTGKTGYIQQKLLPFLYISHLACIETMSVYKAIG